MRMATVFAVLLGLAIMIWPFVAQLSLGMICTCMGGGLVSIGVGCLFYDDEDFFHSHATGPSWDEEKRVYRMRGSEGAVAHLAFDAIQDFHVYQYKWSDSDDEPSSGQMITSYGIKAYKRDGGRLIVDRDFDTIESAEEEVARLKTMVGIEDGAESSSADSPPSDSAEIEPQVAVYSPRVLVQESNESLQWSWDFTPKASVFLTILCICGGLSISILGNVIFAGESAAYLILLVPNLIFFGLGLRHLYTNYGLGKRLSFEGETLRVEHLWAFRSHRTETVDIHRVKAVVYENQTLSFFDGIENNKRSLLSIPLKPLPDTDGVNLENQIGELIARKTGGDAHAI